MPDPVGTNSALFSALEATIGLKGSALSPGEYADIEIPWPCTVFRWTLLGDQIGSGVVDLLRCTESQFDGGVTHPVAGDSITNGAPPTISGAAKGQSAFPPGWAPLNFGDIVRVYLNSVTTLTQIGVSLVVVRGLW